MTDRDTGALDEIFGEKEVDLDFDAVFLPESERGEWIYAEPGRAMAMRKWTNAAGQEGMDVRDDSTGAELHMVRHSESPCHGQAFRLFLDGERRAQFVPHGGPSAQLAVAQLWIFRDKLDPNIAALFPLPRLVG